MAGRGSERILTIKSGASSIKFFVYAMDGPERRFMETLCGVWGWPLRRLYFRFSRVFIHNPSG
jgi:hypothetical protein